MHFNYNYSICVFEFYPGRETKSLTCKVVSPKVLTLLCQNEIDFNKV